MKLDIEKTNYLQVLIIEEYYALIEVLNPYMQIEFNVNAKRDLYEDILGKFQPFSNIYDMEKSIEILNNTVFFHQKKIKKIPLSLPKDKIANLNSKGFNLLELNTPFSKRELRKAYLVGIQRYHPNTGGNKKDMKNVNDAYLLYRNFLSFENYIKNQGTKAGYFNISNGEEFYLHVYSILLEIYIDIWELDKAYGILMAIMNNLFTDTGIFDDYNDLMMQRIQRNINMLVISLSGSGKDQLATTITEKIDTCKCDDSKMKNNNYIPPYNCDKHKNEFVKNLKKTIKLKEKKKIILTHKLHAVYAFNNGFITEKRYKDAMKRFEGKDKKTEVSQNILNTWLETNSFLELSFDREIKFTEIANLIPRPDTFTNKNIYTITKEQQNEYYFTFYMKPTIKSINKYMYFRLYGYIFSLKEFKNKESYLSIIIDECRLFLKLYENNPIPQTSKLTSKVISEFIDYLIEFSESVESNHEEKFNTLSKPPENWWYLNMDGGLGDPYAYAPWGEKNMHKKPEMTRKEILDEIHDEYKDHEYFEELIENTDFFFDLGKMLCAQRYGKNIELAKEVFNIAVEEDLEGDTYIMLELIKNISSSKLLNDKEWAKEIYLKVQNDIEAYSNDLVVCAEIITKKEYLNDKNWGRKIIQKALDEVDNASNLITLADIVASSEGLNNKRWAKEISLTATMKANGLFDYLQLGDLLSKKDGLNDIKLAKESYILATKDCEGKGDVLRLLQSMS